jgi:hypothetical protein
MPAESDKVPPSNQLVASTGDQDENREVMEQREDAIPARSSIGIADAIEGLNMEGLQ